jgi:hypothetical protein
MESMIQAQKDEELALKEFEALYSRSSGGPQVFAARGRGGFFPSPVAGGAGGDGGDGGAGGEADGEPAPEKAECEMDECCMEDEEEREACEEEDYCEKEEEACEMKRRIVYHLEEEREKPSRIDKRRKRRNIPMEADMGDLISEIPLPDPVDHEALRRAAELEAEYEEARRLDKEEDERARQGGGRMEVEEGEEEGGREEEDLTEVPGRLDRKYEELDEDSALRPTIINPGKVWTKKFQSTLLSPPSSMFFPLLLPPLLSPPSSMFSPLLSPLSSVFFLPLLSPPSSMFSPLLSPLSSVFFLPLLSPPSSMFFPLLLPPLLSPSSMFSPLLSPLSSVFFLFASFLPLPSSLPPLFLPSHSPQQAPSPQKNKRKKKITFDLLDALSLPPHSLIVPPSLSLLACPSLLVPPCLFLPPCPTSHLPLPSLSLPSASTLSTKEQEEEKKITFDLLDALSRSGSLDIDYASLHVVIAATHCFAESLMSTVVKDSINPIEKVWRGEGEGRREEGGGKEGRRGGGKAGGRRREEGGEKKNQC